MHNSALLRGRNHQRKRNKTDTHLKAFCCRRGAALLPQWRLVNGVWSLFIASGLLLTSLLVRQVQFDDQSGIVREERKHPRSVYH